MRVVALVSIADRARNWGAAVRGNFSSLGTAVDDLVVAVEGKVGAADLSGDVATLHPAGAGGGIKNVYGPSTYTSAIGARISNDDAPTDDPRPLLWVSKRSTASRSQNPSEWDNGAIYAALIKEGGNAYAAALTGVARHESADGGHVIGVHGRGAGYDAQAEVWGGWSYGASIDPAVPVKSIIGHEVNLQNKAPDQGWMSGTGVVGQSRGLVVVTADGSNPVTFGAYIGAGVSAPAGKMHTGLVLAQDSIVPSGANSGTQVNDNEAIRLEGATVPADGATAIRLRGNHRTGVSFAEASISNNAAVLLGEGHRIVVGPGPASSNYLAFSKAGAYVDFVNLAFRLNGVQIVGARKTGWGVPTGTATKSGFDTGSATLPVVAEHLAALINDLRNHGLIGA